MIRTPAMGCVRSSWAKSTSARGQLEQPADVNSWTTTGFYADTAAGASARAATLPQVIVIRPSSWSTDLIILMMMSSPASGYDRGVATAEGRAREPEGAGRYFFALQPLSTPQLLSPPFLPALSP